MKEKISMPVETMLRVKFDPMERRQALVSRLLELRDLVPRLETEKSQIEGMLSMLNEISPPPQGGQFMPPEPPGDQDTENGSNGNPKES